MCIGSPSGCVANDPLYAGGSHQTETGYKTNFLGGSHQAETTRRITNLLTLRNTNKICPRSCELITQGNHLVQELRGNNYLMMRVTANMHTPTDLRVKDPKKYEKKTLLQPVCPRKDATHSQWQQWSSMTSGHLLCSLVKTHKPLNTEASLAPLPLRWTTEWSHQPSTVGKATRLNPLDH